MTGPEAIRDRRVVFDLTLCGIWMPNAKTTCARWPGHTTPHRSAYALDNAYRAATGRQRKFLRLSQRGTAP